jgi:hypothetical protein
LIETGEKAQPGIDGAITKREAPTTVTVNTIQVPALENYVMKVTKN